MRIKVGRLQKPLYSQITLCLDEDNEGFEYSAIGISDGDEITEIDIDSIECIGYMDNNPDDGSWVGR